MVLATLETIKTQAEHLVSYAARLGIVITVEQKPLEPRAMGHFETVVSVREGRP